MNLNVNRLYYTTGWNNIDVRDIDSWRIPQVGPSYYIIMIILGVGHTCQVVYLSSTSALNITWRGGKHAILDNEGYDELFRANMNCINNTGGCWNAKYGVMICETVRE